MLDEHTEASVRLHFANPEDPRAWIIFHLYMHDVQGTVASFNLFNSLLSALDPGRLPEMMYHASCFICAARRVGRMLETMAKNGPKNGHWFAPPVAKVIKLEWRKRRLFFDSLIEPRNAIEHIDKEAKGPIKPVWFSVVGDRFVVTSGKSVRINAAALATITSSLDCITHAIIKQYPA